MITLIAIITGIACYSLGWLMRGKSAVVDAKLAKDMGYQQGYRKGLEAPCRALKPIAK